MLDNVTPEQLAIIQEIAHRLAPKFRFGYYDIEDIEQEAIALGIDAIKRWDSKRPLQNFIYTHIKNRLGTLKRDKYYRVETGKSAKIQEAKKGLLDTVDIEGCGGVYLSDTSAHYDTEIIDIINERLPASMRGDYLRLLEGTKVATGRKAVIISSIKEIVGNYYEEN